MKKIFIFSLLGLMFSACVDLDIPQKNAVTDNDLLTNPDGMKIYLARLYSTMPFEDFKYLGQWGLRQNSWLGALGIDGSGEAVNRDGICTTFRGEDTSYWNSGGSASPFYLMRDANHLLENLPKYKGNFSDPVYNHYLGEGYFARAMAAYAMAKRFGGIPYVTREIPYPDDGSGIEVPRWSEEETWDQICADFKAAAEHMQPNKLDNGSDANKYVALAYLAEAMNYAGCVAKYNETVPGRLTGFGAKTGVRVIGFDPDTAEDASIRYFQEAYEAARQIMESGKYLLQTTSTNTPEAKYQNMVALFGNADSKEHILVKEYVYPTLTHGIDAYSSPYSWHMPLAGGSCPTADFVELFDGLERYPDGTLKVTTGDTNTQGTYEMFDTSMDFFANAEPRLRAYVIFPGDMFKNKLMDIRGGIYTGPTPIAPFFSDYSYASAETRYQHIDAFKNGTLKMSAGPSDGDTVWVDLPEGSQLASPAKASGAEGPWYAYAEASLTGLYLRKYLNPDPSFTPGEGRSAQPFILMRYADVLLAAAEAAVELSIAGATPKPAADGGLFTGDDMLQVATDAIAAIRDRAGADPLVGKITGDIDGRGIVRKERRKELAFEHKSKWDIRRWRVQHPGARDYFWGDYREGYEARSSSNTNYRLRGLYPFYSSTADQYFYDVRYQWISLKTLTYNVVDYYFSIPSGQVSKSSVIDQQPNR